MRTRDPANERGGRYVWLNYTNTSTQNTCFADGTFLYRAQHESSVQHFPTGPIQVCKTGTGRFTVNLDSSNFLGIHFIAPYHADDISPVVSARSTGGGYCNPHLIVCNSANCTGLNDNPPSKIDVRCYNREGTAQNAPFNLSMYY